MPETDFTTDRLAARLTQIRNAAQGPSVGAFFDFDGTLIDGFSALYLVKERWKQGQIGMREASELLTFALNRDPSDADFHELISNAVARWKGMTEDALIQQWQQIFVRHMAQTVFPEAWKLVKTHQRMGHTVAIASSATRYQILPAACELGIEHVLASAIRIRDGQVSGRLDGGPLWNQAKADAVRRFAGRHDLRLDASFAYANGDEDRAFLGSVGQPCAINPKPRLAAEASRRGWPILSFAPRAISLRDKARTVASYATMAGTFAAGLLGHRLGAPHRQMLNTVTSTAPQLGLAAAGIGLRIHGEENLWKARPAVFVFNHQSPLDLVIGVNLLRRDATGVAKKEMENMTGWGQFGRFMDMAFVDRGDPDKARAALAPAVEKLKAGISLGICPEGTRSYSPRLGPFKKGAFHMAMQAGVPVVPVVMRNVGEVMHRDAVWMRPGTVDICVLPPVDTRGWTRDNLERQIEGVRRLFLDTLEHWPGESAPVRPVAGTTTREPVR